jgi:uncharacterized protein (DUF2252 family)
MSTPIAQSSAQPGTFTRAERYAAGKSLRTQVPRSRHAEWSPEPQRADPISMLEEDNRTRLPTLVPIRYGRMSLSSFTFLRGAAGIMANDLASTPISGIKTQICGDAHLGNFGIYATPERRQVFDVNDFDETVQGPWEWDVKRLAASAIVAGRRNGFTASANRQITLKCVQTYRETIRRFATMYPRDVWYASIDIQSLIGVLNRKDKMLRKTFKEARQHTSLHAFPKLTDVIHGQYRIKDEPPLIVHYDDPRRDEKLRMLVVEYMATLAEDRRTLLNHYHLVDIAQKVVGVGSVGTRCYIALLLSSDNDDPLFIQIKEARSSVFEPHVGRAPYPNHAQRVVQGQRLMQAASDILLGWTHDETFDFYVRQLRDMKLSADIATLDTNDFLKYVQFCATALARAHARSGDPVLISGYLGSSAVFEQAIASFAEAYAEQTERDYATLLTAIKDGRVHAETDV